MQKVVTGGNIPVVSAGNAQTALSSDAGRRKMDTRFHSVTITVYDRDSAFTIVSKLLHEYAAHIQARLGYPIPDKNVAVIFLILKMSNDSLGALTGKLGQIQNVSVKANTLKIEGDK